MKKALIIVDYQYDFADPNGSLYVQEGETIKDAIVTRIEEFRAKGWPIIFSQDWHPENHISFTQWPIHCLANSKGAQLYVKTKEDDLIIKKGINKSTDSYSAFFIGENIPSELNDYLQTNKIDELEICGLALDICVNATYLDAKKLNYKANVNLSLTKAIDKNFKLAE